MTKSKFGYCFQCGQELAKWKCPPCEASEPRFKIGDKAIWWEPLLTNDPREVVVTDRTENDGVWYYSLNHDEAHDFAMYLLIKPDDLLSVISARQKMTLQDNRIWTDQ